MNMGAAHKLSGTTYFLLTMLTTEQVDPFFFQKTELEFSSFKWCYICCFWQSCI